MTQQNPDDKQLFKSHWDRLPAELQIMIFKRTNTLTLFLNERLKKIDNKTIHSIWVDALSSNWHGDLSLLPFPPVRGIGVLENSDLAPVSSRNLYGRLCKRLPHATEINPTFKVIDETLDKSCSTDMDWRKFWYDRTYEITAIRLLHIPMNNMWFDLLQNMTDKYPYAIAYRCIHLDYRGMLLHLINTNKVDVMRIQSFQYYGHRCYYTAMDSLALHGHIELLKFFHSVGCRNITKEAFRFAVRNGHLDVLVWLYENYADRAPNNTVDEAASQNQIHVLKWLHEHHRELFDNVSWYKPAENGQLQVIRCYHEMGVGGCTSSTMDVAATNGHLDIVKFLHENRSEGCNTQAMNLAAHEGHLDVVKFLHENRSEGCTNQAMDNAASEGHLEVVKWLHENRSEGCTTRAIDEAAVRSHVDVVRFLVKNRTEGYTYNVQTFESVDIIELLVRTKSVEERVAMLADATKEKCGSRLIEALNRSFIN